MTSESFAARRALTAWRLLVCLGLALLTFGAYGRLFANGFIDLDDNTYITFNPNIQSGLTGHAFVWAWTTLRHNYWHPLTWLSLALDVSLFGFHPWAIHLTNLVLHTATSLMLFLLFERLTGAFWRSAALAALFAVHPLHVESVAWAAERKDVLSTFFLVLTLAAYGAYARRPTWGRWALTAAVFTLGLLAKPMLVTLPFGLLLFDIWPLGRWRLWGTAPALPNALPPQPWWRLLREKTLLFLLAIAFGSITLALQRHSQTAVSFEALPLGARIANMLSGYLWYLAKTMAPTNIGLFYVLRLDRTPPWWEIILAASLLLTITGALAQRFSRQPELLVGWLWFLGTMLPVSGLFQSGEQAYAARFAYVPHIGLFITLVWGAGYLARWWRLPTAIVGLAAAGALSACAVLTWQQVTYWRDVQTIWEHTLDVTGPMNFRAQWGLGIHYTEQGMPAEAEEHLRICVELLNDYSFAHPNTPEVLFCLGLAQHAQGRPEEGEENVRLALQLRPGFGEAQEALSMILLEQGRVDESLAILSALVREHPEQPIPHIGLGIVLVHRGKKVEAIHELEAALEIAPHHPDAEFQLGVLALREGRLLEAERRFREALKRAPRHREAGGYLALVLSRLGQPQDAAAQYAALAARNPQWARKTAAIAYGLATRLPPRERFGTRALELATQTCEATAFADPICLEALAAALAECGDIEGALARIDQAIARAGPAEEELSTRLAEYRRRLIARPPLIGPERR